MPPSMRTTPSYNSAVIGVGSVSPGNVTSSSTTSPAGPARYSSSGAGAVGGSGEVKQPPRSANAAPATIQRSALPNTALVLVMPDGALAPSKWRQFRPRRAFSRPEDGGRLSAAAQRTPLSTQGSAPRFVPGERLGKGVRGVFVRLKPGGRERFAIPRMTHRSP